MTQVDITDADREAARAIAETLEIPWAADGGYFADHLLALLARLRIAADRAGYERGVRESAGVAQNEPGKYPHGNMMYGPSVGPKIAAQILNLIPGGDDA